MKFVAHPNVQQLLSAMWYKGLPGFRRKTMIAQVIQVLSIAVCFPLHSMLYILGPNTEKGAFLKKPFIKFICHSASYLFFLCNFFPYLLKNPSNTGITLVLVLVLIVGFGSATGSGFATYRICFN